MKLHAIACEVLSRECFYAAARSPHVVSISAMPSNLHDEPDKLRSTVQEEIDKASGGKYDYILLAYGLCSRETADLVARDTPIVIPRAHDCITLLLGFQEVYQKQFSEHPGTYYYSSGWIEHKDGELRSGTFESRKDRQYKEKFQEYVEKYGEDNAKYLMEQEQQWLVNYNRAALIDLPLGDAEFYKEFTRKIAESHGWTMAEIEGDLRLFDKLFNGDWNPDEFLIIKPGQHTVERINDGIISAESLSRES